MNGLLYPDIDGGLDPKNLALLQAGLGIMAAGPGRSFGQAVGMGGMQGVQAYQQAVQQAEMKKMRLAQMMEQKRLHDAQITNYEANAEGNKAQAEQRRKAAERQALQSQYMQSPEVQAALARGDLSVLTRMPGVGAEDLFKYAEHLGRKDKAPMSRKIRRGESEVTQEWRDGKWSDVAEGPAFARQVAPAVTVHQPASVTPVTIQDPNDPNKTVVVDGRTGRVIGAGPKLTEAGKLENKRQFNMSGIGATIQEADDLLSGVKREPTTGTAMPGTKPTGSGIGTVYDTVAGWVGANPSGSIEAQKLKAVSGALTSKMPRMEGPQSDKDTQLYREMSAEVGNSNLPVERRRAALDVVKNLWAKYENLNPEAFSGATKTKRYNPATGKIE